MLRPRVPALIGLICVTMFAGAIPAAAAPAITVSKSAGLKPDGDRITVNGTGFDVTKGIYVAVCVDNGPGQVPTPCLGGADQSGSAGGSAWISSNPPSYGAGLATPYGPGGTFSVTLAVVGKDPVTGTDCTKVACAAVTRTDHTRTADRSQDARIRLSFAAPKAPAQPPAAPPPTTVPAPPPTTAPTETTTSTVPTTSTTEPSTVSATSPSAPASANVEPAASTVDTGVGPGWWIAAVVLLLAIATVAVLRWLRGRRTRPAD